MKEYLLKLDGQERGSFVEAQVSQLFADGRVGRDTPCRPATGGDWKTIDEYLPMLKYGTQLPILSSPTASAAAPPIGGSMGSVAYVDTHFPRSSRISLVDIDLPFLSILKLMFKWMAAAFVVGCCFIPAALVVFAIVMAIFGSLFSGVFGGLHHP